MPTTDTLTRAEATQPDLGEVPDPEADESHIVRGLD